MDGEITGPQLRALLEGDGSDATPPANCRIVDIRPSEAFERAHIPGSENVPAPELTGRVEELDGAERVVTVCPHGKASVQAARLIASYEGVAGPVESLAGGITAWEGPIVSEGGAETGDAELSDDEPAAPF